MHLFSINKKLIKLFLLLGGVWSGQVHALITCELRAGRYDILQLTPSNISAGPDLPLGSVIYRGTWQDKSHTDQIVCNTNMSTVDYGQIRHELGIDSAPSPLSSWTGSPFSGKVYTTNVPGIGIAVWYAGTSVTTTSPLVLQEYTIQVDSSTLPRTFGYWTTFDISLIKIGETPPGNYVIDSSSFPVTKLYYTAKDNVAGFPIIVRRIGFSGVLNVSAQTCTTPDVNVDLSTHHISELSGGGVTPWVGFNIQLTNCPIYKGYYGGGNPVDLVAGTYNSPTNNQFGIRLTPVDNIINATDGIMAVTPTANSATGVGIQVAIDETGSKTPFNFSQEKIYTSVLNGPSVINIPMAARYIKTGTTITPGRADGKITYTINYY